MYVCMRVCVYVWCTWRIESMVMIVDVLLRVCVYLCICVCVYACMCDVPGALKLWSLLQRCYCVCVCVYVCMCVCVFV